jgi:hypothetical protein
MSTRVRVHRFTCCSKEPLFSHENPFATWDRRFSCLLLSLLQLFRNKTIHQSISRFEQFYLIFCTSVSPLSSCRTIEQHHGFSRSTRSRTVWCWDVFSTKRPSPSKSKRCFRKSIRRDFCRCRLQYIYSEPKAHSRRNGRSRHLARIFPFIASNHAASHHQIEGPLRTIRQFKGATTSCQAIQGRV